MASFRSCDEIMGGKEKKSSTAKKTPTCLVNLDITISPL
jgi:hypothetical protein